MPFALSLYALVAIVIISALVIAFGAVMAFVKSRKQDRGIRKNIFVTLLCIAIAAISWILNMGWLRLSMTFLLIPFFHAIIFFLVNIFSLDCVQKSKKSKSIYIMLCITYLLPYLLLPDFGDTNEGYLFFGLIHVHGDIPVVFGAAAWIAALAHIVLLILQTAKIIKMRKSGE